MFCGSPPCHRIMGPAWPRTGAVEGTLRQTHLDLKQGGQVLSPEPAFQWAKTAFNNFKNIIHTPKEYIFLLFLLFISYAHTFCLPVCLYSIFMSGTIEDQKRMWESLELELQVVINYHVGTGNWTWVLWIASSQCFQLLRNLSSPGSTKPLSWPPPGSACGMCVVSLAILSSGSRS